MVKVIRGGLGAVNESYDFQLRSRPTRGWTDVEVTDRRPP